MARPGVEQPDKNSNPDPGTQLARHFNATFMPLQRHPDLPSDYHKVRIVESACHEHRALDSSNRRWLSASITLEHANNRQTLHLTTSSTFFSRSVAASQQVFVHVPALGSSIGYSRYTLLSYGESERARFQGDEKVDELRIYKSVMPCKVLKLLKGKGDKVNKGEAMLVVESMKTEVKIVASVNGGVRAEGEGGRRGWG